MKNVGLKKIKEICTRGAILLMLTGTITTITMSGLTYTVSAATKTLKSTKSSALKKLLAAYNSYDKNNYYSTQYKSITKYYNTGVTKINDCKTESGVSKMLDTYKKKMSKVKDKKTVLAEYKVKMQKSLLEYYKSLVEQNDYDLGGLNELESIYDTYNTKINKTTTMTKTKKYKNTAISKMENVCTKVIVNTDGSKTMSLEQVDKKVKTLCKKYPAYTEDEIRTLYVSINQTEFNLDLYECLGISTKAEMEEKAVLLDELLYELFRTDYYQFLELAQRPFYTPKYEYKDRIYLPDFIENAEIKEQCKKMDILMQNNTNIVTRGKCIIGDGDLKCYSTVTMVAYFYNYYNRQYYTYIEECVPKYSIDSEEAKTRSDLRITNLYIAWHINTDMIDWRYTYYYPPGYDNLLYDVEQYIKQNQNPIYDVLTHKLVLNGVKK